MNCSIKPILCAAAAALLASNALAHEAIYQAILSGPNESPANASPGTGTATVTVDLDLVTMRVQVDFAGLTGTTTASHIHAPTIDPFTSTAGVATQTPTFTGFPLDVTAGTYDHTFDLTQASSYNPAFVTANGGTVSGALNSLLGAMDSGRSYLNIHTSTFAAGEIRGFLVAVPEPTTLAAIGGAATVIARRRRR